MTKWIRPQFDEAYPKSQGRLKLVCGWGCPSERYEFVNFDDYSQDMETQNSCSKPQTSKVCTVVIARNPTSSRVVILQRDLTTNERSSWSQMDINGLQSTYERNIVQYTIISTIYYTVCLHIYIYIHIYHIMIPTCTL